MGVKRRGFVDLGERELHLEGERRQVGRRETPVMILNAVQVLDQQVATAGKVAKQRLDFRERDGIDLPSLRVSHGAATPLTSMRRLGFVPRGLFHGRSTFRAEPVVMSRDQCSTIVLHPMIRRWVATAKGRSAMSWSVHAGDHARVVRLAVGWVALSVTIGGGFLLPSLLIVCVLWPGATWPERCAFIAPLVLTSLPLLAAVRVGGRVIAHTRRWSSYPKAHWRRAVQTLWGSLAFMLIGATLATGGTAFAIFGRSSIASPAVWWILFRRCDRFPRVLREPQ